MIFQSATCRNAPLKPAHIAEVPGYGRGYLPQVAERKRVARKRSVSLNRVPVRVIIPSADTQDSEARQDPHGDRCTIRPYPGNNYARDRA